MKAQKLVQERQQLSEHAFVELRIWRVPRQVPGSDHDLKYSLALIANGICVLRYDNEAGKGDHRHLGTTEELYAFESREKLVADFWKDVDEWQVD